MSMFQAFSAYSETDSSARKSPLKVAVKDLALPWKISLLVDFLLAHESQQLCSFWIGTQFRVTCFCDGMDFFNCFFNFFNSSSAVGVEALSQLKKRRMLIP